MLDDLYDAFEQMVEEVYDENKDDIDDNRFDNVAYSAAAELLGYLEGRLIRAGLKQNTIDGLRNSYIVCGLNTEIEIHKKTCSVAGCEAHAWLEQARAYYERSADLSEKRTSLWRALLAVFQAWWRS